MEDICSKNLWKNTSQYFLAKVWLKGENETVKNEIRNESWKYSGNWGLPFTNEKSDGGQKGHDPNHGGEMASTGFHIHDTHFHVHFLHEKPSWGGHAAKNNNGEKLEEKKITWVTLLKFYSRIIWSHQSADSHANNGPSEEGEGVGCATGLGPSKGPLTIAPRVHPEDNVPQENRPRKRLNKLYVAASSSLCAKAAAVVAAAVEDRFTRLLLAAAKALLQVERRPCSSSRESSFYTLTLATDLI